MNRANADAAAPRPAHRHNGGVSVRIYSRSQAGSGKVGACAGEDGVAGAGRAGEPSGVSPFTT